MKINDEHLFHGAALNQIAEDPHFTAINAVKHKGGLSRSAFGINDNIGVFLKYCTEPKGASEEYLFNFRFEHLEELKALTRKFERVYLALICVMDGQICCLPYDKFQELIKVRRREKGEGEDQYQILVVLPPRSAFRVYVNRPGRRNYCLGKITIPRKDFPAALFERK